MTARLDSLIGPETALETDAQGDAGSIVVSSITADSRQVTPGALFVAMPGTKIDGTAFIPQAIASGAAAILAPDGYEFTQWCPVPVLRAVEPRIALARIAARFYGPGPDTVVAVTGTSGKTSVAEFTRQIFARLGFKAASLGTLGVVSPSGASYGSLTTPDPVTLARTLAALRAEGVTHLAMEASSHGLDQHRLDGVTLAAGAFTNLGRDHLDYHPTMDDYLKAKLGLFERLLRPGQPAVVNSDGARSDDVMTAARRRGLDVLSTGSRGSTIRLDGVTRDGFCQILTLHADGQTITTRLPLLGAYQVENALLAAGLAIAAGADAADAIAALEHLVGVPGRLEVAAQARGGLAVVDYAHKPEALAACLDALRPFATGKLICVMGCGGDRDRGKRPIMGRIAAEKSDIVIVTDDNPRTEPPAAIRAEVLAGIAPADAASVREIGDRTEAIREAVAMLAPGNVVVVAGKGHETGQIVGGTVLPFCDRDEIIAALSGGIASASAITASTTAPNPPPASPAPTSPAPAPVAPLAPAPVAASPVANAERPPLWSIADAIAATRALADGVVAGPITGVSIDTRSLVPGDLFVALADQRDGHEFVTTAFKAGAAAALVKTDYVRQPGDGLLLRVPDPLAGLENLGRAARAWLSPEARVIAVTGSAGKTTAKEMLRAALSAIGETHASEKSYNNHWGVPLTLARMPATTRFAVFEIGMNHAGEITPLSRMVRPHVAVITTVAPAHLGNFDSIEGIADAKAEIFAGLEPGGLAVIPRDNAHFERLKRQAEAAASSPAIVISDFGEHEATQSLKLDGVELHVDGSSAAVQLYGIDHGRLDVGIPGRHNLLNAAAVLAAIATFVPLSDDRPRQALKTFGHGAAGAMAGRGRVEEFDGILLIDESYNANPASMRAALETMALQPRDRRRIAVLGDMLELGAQSAALHAGLAEAIIACGVDLVLASGPNMAHLYAKLPLDKRGEWAATSAGLERYLLETVRSGDVVMIKGSNGSRMAPLVAALKSRHIRAPANG